MSYVSGRLFAGETSLDTNAIPVSTTTSNIREVLLQADSGNSTNVLVGSALDQQIVLTPGQSITVPIVSLSRLYCKMASGTGIVNWLARD